MSTKLDLNLLHLFVALYETGSFTATAERMGVTKAKVSIAIARLEKQLGVPLFKRTTRKVVSTQAGERLYSDTSPLLIALHCKLSETQNDEHELRGNLKIGCHAELMVSVLAPVVAAFEKQYPKVNLEIRTTDVIHDINRENMDILFKFNWMKEESSKVQAHGTVEQFLVATPEYWSKKGRPSHPDDIQDFNWIALLTLPRPMIWSFSHKRFGDVNVQVKPHIRTDSGFGVKEMLLQGSGISILDEMTISKELKSGALEPALMDWKLPEGQVIAVTPHEKVLSPQVKTFIDLYNSWAKK